MDIGRNTIQRQCIYDSLKELDNHAAAEQVYEHVIKKYPSISKATVYRNLGQMADAGDILNIGSIYGAIHYDHNCHKHYHFVCEKCKQVYDIEYYFPDLHGEITNIDGFEITSHNLLFYGLCKECKAWDNVK